MIAHTTDMQHFVQTLKTIIIPQGHVLGDTSEIEIVLIMNLSLFDSMMMKIKLNRKIYL